ncbi:hypothetical protein D4764_18G0009930 [Takifugu flavidus]|uniref:Uncharacterized protein n=1 Tax=Takifugu flavidus TaxID=433684 RepID=A0A5C6NWX8_9TELE|nr:hypothetical protein D4764_18G0009930 [Takifugu flavidus]
MRPRGARSTRRLHGRTVGGALEHPPRWLISTPLLRSDAPPLAAHYTSSMRAKYLANSRPDPNPDTPPDQ